MNGTEGKQIVQRCAAQGAAAMLAVTADQQAEHLQTKVLWRCRQSVRTMMLHKDHDAAQKP
jgi:hypothetical protein